MKFNEYLKNLRLEKGLSINKLSKLSGVSQSYLSQVESGSRGTPSIGVLVKLAPHLGVSSDNLVTASIISETDKNFEHTDFSLESSMNSVLEANTAFIVNDKNINLLKFVQVVSDADKLMEKFVELPEKDRKEILYLVEMKHKLLKDDQEAP